MPGKGRGSQPGGGSRVCYEGVFEGCCSRVCYEGAARFPGDAAGGFQWGGGSRPGAAAGFLGGMELGFSLERGGGGVGYNMVLIERICMK
jgi:hypothetical protein